MRDVIVLAIGGLDPSGGAGLVRDFLTGRTLGALVRLVPTAFTDQSPAGVRGVEPRDPQRLAGVLRKTLRDAQQVRAPDRHPGMPTTAVKIGMLPNARAAEAVADALVGYDGPIVLDPVLWASSGGVLFDGEPATLLSLCTRATLVTPNAAEASALTRLPVTTHDQAAAAGRALCARGARAVLVKGGHIGGEGATDVLVTASEVRQFTSRRSGGAAVRGTGCALATAIAVGLGRGLSVADAVVGAKTWLSAAIAAAVDVEGGERHLP